MGTLVGPSSGSTGTGTGSGPRNSSCDGHGRVGSRREAGTPVLEAVTRLTDCRRPLAGPHSTRCDDVADHGHTFAGPDARQHGRGRRLTVLGSSLRGTAREVCQGRNKILGQGTSTVFIRRALAGVAYRTNWGTLALPSLVCAPSLAGAHIPVPRLISNPYSLRRDTSSSGGGGHQARGGDGAPGLERG